MLTSITPLGERSRRRNWASTVTAYFIGSVAGGTILGTAAGGAGTLISAVWRPTDGTLLTIGITVLAIVALSELGVVTVPLIPRHRQVSENWLDEYRGWVIGAGFGFQLGIGLATVVTTAAVPAMVLLAALSFSWKSGLLIGATFGLVRALPILFARSIQAPAQLAALHRRYDAWAPGARRVAAAAAGVVAMGAVVL